MRTELISIPTPTHPLDGAYYTPDGPIKGAAMYCHGNQMNFYVCAARFLARPITALGYAFLAFNRRGHDSVSTFNSREPVGGAYQTVAEGIETQIDVVTLDELCDELGLPHLPYLEEMPEELEVDWDR